MLALHTKFTFEEGWSFVQKDVIKLIKNIEGESEPLLFYFYTIAYQMCIHKPDYSAELYEKYSEVIEDYAIQTVLPSLREKHGEDMLRELVRRWNNHKILVKRLTIVFGYLDKYFIPRRRIPSLSEVGLTCFRDLIYREMQSTATEVVLALIHKERKGEQIDRELVENVLEVYAKIGMGTMEKYDEDFERFMLQDTVSYYSRKASMWMKECSSSDYLLKACRR
ncbi:PREDICTED: putative cullin-like protein 2, partial [Camelina sativa]|uniref:Cullin-like protein 2 n=1 Tax=Camelina sativa TaxID=90675 RepID=A0ABM1R2M0_CAMSA